WPRLSGDQGRQAGPQAMLEVLQLGRRHGPERLQAAVETALALGCQDAAAIRHLLATPTLGHPPPPALAPPALARFDRPVPALDRYDELLAAGAPPVSPGGGPRPPRAARAPGERHPPPHPLS